MAENDEKDPPATDGDKKPEEHLGDAGKKALDAERAARKKLEDEVKELRPLAAKAKEAEDAKKGEVERLTEQLAAATRERDAAMVDRDKFKVGLAKGLTLTQAKRLVGSTEDEFTTDADELIADLGAKPGEPKPTPAGKPREHLKAGSGDPDQPVEETDVKALGARMFAS
jgi:hypothetical protein